MTNNQFDLFITNLNKEYSINPKSFSSNEDYWVDNFGLNMYIGKLLEFLIISSKNKDSPLYFPPKLIKKCFYEIYQFDEPLMPKEMCLSRIANDLKRVIEKLCKKIKKKEDKN